MTESLGIVFPQQIARVETILGYYEEIGRPGAWAAQNIRQTLQAAKDAFEKQDTVAMMRLFPELETIE